MRYNCQFQSDMNMKWYKTLNISIVTSKFELMAWLIHMVKMAIGMVDSEKVQKNGRALLQLNLDFTITFSLIDSSAVFSYFFFLQLNSVTVTQTFNRLLSESKNGMEYKLKSLHESNKLNSSL